jgi:membrane fusion protein, multidrug efflux system
VQANYKETQVRQIHAGDPAEIRVDAFPGVIIHGKVDQLSPASRSVERAMLPRRRLSDGVSVVAGSLEEQAEKPACSQNSLPAVL